MRPGGGPAAKLLPAVAPRGHFLAAREGEGVKSCRMPGRMRMACKPRAGGRQRLTGKSVLPGARSSRSRSSEPPPCSPAQRPAALTRLCRPLLKDAGPSPSDPPPPTPMQPGPGARAPEAPSRWPRQLGRELESAPRAAAAVKGPNAPRSPRPLHFDVAFFWIRVSCTFS